MTFKFHISPYSNPGWARYQHTTVVLAEGFQALGLKYTGNIDYWWNVEEGEYLIQKSADDNADVHIYSSHLLLDDPSYMEKIDWTKYNVFIDNEDGFDTPAMEDKYAKFNLILRCHVNKKFYTFTEKMEWAQEKRSNFLPQVKPWNFGLSNRIINYVDKYRGEEVKDRVLCNFRMPHNMRKLGVEGFNKVLSNQYEIYNNVTEGLDVTETDDDKGYWAQTGRRHNEQYYKDINGSKFTYAFGGKLWQDPIGSNKALKMKSIYYKGMDFIKKKISGVEMYAPEIYTMTQYGGWRFFESFLSNTVPIQIDLAYWGCEWPEMPIASKHYWAVKGTNFEASAKELIKLSDEELQKISDQGREWVLKHYSPTAVANRFLSYIEK